MDLYEYLWHTMELTIPSYSAMYYNLLIQLVQWLAVRLGLSVAYHFNEKCHSIYLLKHFPYVPIHMAACMPMANTSPGKSSSTASFLNVAMCLNMNSNIRILSSMVLLLLPACKTPTF